MSVILADLYGCDVIYDAANTLAPEIVAEKTVSAAVCGNAVVEKGEQCDDGNEDDNDHCKRDCTLDDAVFVVVKNTEKSNLNKSEPAPPFSLRAATTLYETEGFETENIELKPTDNTRNTYVGAIPLAGRLDEKRTVIVFDDVVTRPYPRSGVNVAGVYAHKHVNQKTAIPTDDLFTPCKGFVLDDGRFGSDLLVNNASTVTLKAPSATTYDVPQTKAPFLVRVPRGGLGISGINVDSGDPFDTTDEVFTVATGVALNTGIKVDYQTFARADARLYCNCKNRPIIFVPTGNNTLGNMFSDNYGDDSKTRLFTDDNFGEAGGACPARIPNVNTYY